MCDALPHNARRRIEFQHRLHPEPVQRNRDGPEQCHGQHRTAQNQCPDGRPLVRLERLEVSDTSVDLAKQEVVVGKINSQNLETWAAGKDGQLDWQKLSSQPEKTPAKTAEVVTVEAPKPAPVAPSKPRAVLLKDVGFDYRVHLADKSRKPRWRWMSARST